MRRSGYHGASRGDMGDALGVRTSARDLACELQWARHPPETSTGLASVWYRSRQRPGLCQRVREQRPGLWQRVCELRPATSKTRPTPNFHAKPFRIFGGPQIQSWIYLIGLATSWTTGQSDLRGKNLKPRSPCRCLVRSNGIIRE